MDLMGTRSAVVEAPVLSRVDRQADLVGAYSGYGSYCPEGIPIETAIFAILGAFGVAFGVLYRAVTLITGGRRRKKRESPPKDLWEQVSYKLADIFWWGLEEFEDKVDKIANGQEDDSWIGQLYNQFSSTLGIDGSKIDESELGSKDGLEPPILDETWGLEDIHKLHDETPEDVSANEPRSRSKRDNGVEPDDLKNEVEEDDEIIKGLTGESKCKAIFWKCMGGVASKSLHYMSEPGGITGALKKMMFRVAFHGGIGNVWNALMTIPEARQAKRCMNKQDDCMAFEVLRQEVETLGEDGQVFVPETQKRLLINPEFVEGMDASDGSEKFTPEDQALENSLLGEEDEA